MVGHPRPVGGADLGRADVHAPVDLARVGADDLGAEALGERPATARVLPVRGRAADDDERRQHRSPVRRPRRRPARQRVRARVLDLRPATKRPTSSGPPSRWTSLFCAVPSGHAEGRRRPPARRGRATGVARTWSTRTSTRRPTQARLRSRPMPSWSVEQPVEPAPLDRRRDVVGEAAGGRPGSGRERGREDAVEADRAQQLERALELGVGLAAEADDDVRGEGDARDRGTQPPDQLEVRRRRCTGGPSDGAPRHRPPGPAGGGARRRTRTRPWPR